jgi:peptidoglycan/LPS O-acetylase OafA/YrhL
MNLQNIISAGRMMSIVVSLLGAFHCGVSVALERVVMALDIALGAGFIACGLVLMVMIPRSQRRCSLAAPILALGTLTMLLGAVAVIISWRDPFSWMMAVLGVAIFIDTLCLKIRLNF